MQALSKTFAIAHEQASDDALASALVFNAGRLAWRIRQMGVAVEEKTSVSDVVTAADRAAEDFIAAALRAVRPDDGLLGEEGAHQPSRSGRTWVIDPVDGTYNFSSGADYWCSAVALVAGDPAEGEVLVGAVHRPELGYSWLGGLGHPTTRDGAAVQISEAHTAAQLSLATYLHPESMRHEDIRRSWQQVASRFATVRMLGAGSVDLAGVADGTWGAWLQHSVADWDWLPGKALVEAAGGVGKKVHAGSVEWCLAGPAEIVAEMEAALHG